MPSNFEKRRAKSKEDVAKEIQERREQIRLKAENPSPVVTEAAKPVYTQEGYDVYSPDGGKTYHVAEISYNPETGQAEVTNIFDISRLIALTYANQKIALGTLKKGKK